MDVHVRPHADAIAQRMIAEREGFCLHPMTAENREILSRIQEQLRQYGYAEVTISLLVGSCLISRYRRGYSTADTMVVLAAELYTEILRQAIEQAAQTEVEQRAARERLTDMARFERFVHLLMPAATETTEYTYDAGSFLLIGANNAVQRSIPFQIPENYQQEPRLLQYLWLNLRRPVSTIAARFANLHEIAELTRSSREAGILLCFIELVENQATFPRTNRMTTEEYNEYAAEILVAGIDSPAGNHWFDFPWIRARLDGANTLGWQPGLVATWFNDLLQQAERQYDLILAHEAEPPEDLPEPALTEREQLLRPGATPELSPNQRQQVQQVLQSTVAQRSGRLDEIPSVPTVARFIEEYRLLILRTVAWIEFEVLGDYRQFVLWRLQQIVRQLGKVEVERKEVFRHVCTAAEATEIFTAINGIDPLVTAEGYRRRIELE
jgi:TfoX/Sxy family transcriptional regulator of competence genes